MVVVVVRDRSSIGVGLVLRCHSAQHVLRAWRRPSGLFSLVTVVADKDAGVRCCGRRGDNKISKFFHTKSSSSLNVTNLLFLYLYFSVAK